jgi:hypothetical protein
MKVQFYIEQETGQPMAYFPDQIHNGKLRVCYAHIGQHSSCDPEYLKECKEATPQEYGPLLEELKSIGYDKLEVI